MTFMASWILTVLQSRFSRNKEKDQRYRQVCAVCNTVCVYMLALRQACTELGLTLVKLEREPEYLQKEREGKQERPLGHCPVGGQTSEWERERKHTQAWESKFHTSLRQTQRHAQEMGVLLTSELHIHKRTFLHNIKTHTHSLWMQSGNIKTHGDEARTQAGTNRSNAEVWGPLTSTAPQFAQLVKVLKRRSWTLLCSS